MTNLFEVNGHEYSRSGFQKISPAKLKADVHWVRKFDQDFVMQLGKILPTVDVYVALQYFTINCYEKDKTYLGLVNRVYDQNVSLKKVKNNLPEFEEYFDELLLAEVRSSRFPIEPLLKFLYFEKVTTLDAYQQYIKSPYSEEVKTWNGSRFVMSDSDCKTAKGHLKGKTRPDHGDKIRDKLKAYSCNRSDEHTANLKDFLQNRYKKKRMLNLGLVRDSDSNETVDVAFSNYMSTYNKSDEHKMNKIRSFLLNTKYQDLKIFKSYKQSYSADTTIEVPKAYKTMMSIISTVAYQDDKNDMGSARFFNKGKLDGLRFQLNGSSSMKYKSSYEKLSVEFFENSGYGWSYEPIFIECEETIYTPDFLLNLENGQYLLEVKGYIRDDEHVTKIKKKLTGALKYCEEHNIRLVYLRKPVQHLNDVLDNVIETTEKINSITK